MVCGGLWWFAVVCGGLSFTSSSSSTSTSSTEISYLISWTPLSKDLS